MIYMIYIQKKKNHTFSKADPCTFNISDFENNYNNIYEVELRSKNLRFWTLQQNSTIQN